MHNVSFLLQDITYFQVANFASYELRHRHVAIYKSENGLKSHDETVKHKNIHMNKWNISLINANTALLKY